MTSLVEGSSKWRLQDGAVVLSIPGPSTRCAQIRAQTSMDLAVAVDPLESVARFRAKRQRVYFEGA